MVWGFQAMQENAVYFLILLWFSWLIKYRWHREFDWLWTISLQTPVQGKLQRNRTVAVETMHLLFCFSCVNNQQRLHCSPENISFLFNQGQLGSNNISASFWIVPTATDCCEEIESLLSHLVNASFRKGENSINMRNLTYTSNESCTGGLKWRKLSCYQCEKNSL